MLDRKVAKLHRMVLKDSTCPYGVKAKRLLEKKRYQVEDHLLKTREEVDAFKKKHNVKTTPQIYINDERIGGYDDLKAFIDGAIGDHWFHAYKSIIYIFATTFLMAGMISLRFATFSVLGFLEIFVALSMCALGILKLKDIDAFSNQFIGYDLLGKRYTPYSYVYPFAETIAGVLMLGKFLLWFAAPMAIVIGSIGAVSVLKAVYIDKRDLTCACVGGDSKLPLGFVSLLENVTMILMGVYMIWGSVASVL